MRSEFTLASAADFDGDQLTVSRSVDIPCTSDVGATSSTESRSPNPIARPNGPVLCVIQRRNASRKIVSICVSGTRSSSCSDARLEDSPA